MTPEGCHGRRRSLARAFLWYWINGEYAFLPCNQVALDQGQSVAFTTNPLRTGLLWIYSIIDSNVEPRAMFRSYPPPACQNRNIAWPSLLVAVNFSSHGVSFIAKQAWAFLDTGARGSQRGREPAGRLG